MGFNHYEGSLVFGTQDCEIRSLWGFVITGFVLTEFVCRMKRVLPVNKTAVVRTTSADCCILLDFVESV